MLLYAFLDDCVQLAVQLQGMLRAEAGDYLTDAAVAFHRMT